MEAIDRILKGVEIVSVRPGRETEVTGLCYDSRTCRPGVLFAAVPGLKSDGHDFIREAVEKGAAFVVSERAVPLPPAVTAIRVENSRRALGKISANYFGDPSKDLCLIGVTGTSGKTTVTYLVESILRSAGQAAAVIGTVNYRYGGKTVPAPNTTPESTDLQRLLRDMVQSGVTHGVMEVSSHALDLYRVHDCHFAAGVFTNLSQDHLDYHRTMEDYYRAKKRFFDEVLTGKEVKKIINGDDSWGKRLIGESGGEVTVFGTEREMEIRPLSWDMTLGGIEAVLGTPEGIFSVKSPLIGKFNLYNILAAAAAALAVGIAPSHIRKGIASLDAVPGRLEKVSAPGEPTVFVDYAHKEDALRKVLETLSAFREGRIITVFGCGGDRDRTKRPLMGRAVAERSDLSVITSDNPRTEDPLEIIDQIEEGLRDRPLMKYGAETFEDRFAGRGYVVLPDRREAILRAVAFAGEADIVLVAGKGHEDYQIIGTKKVPFDDRRVAREALNVKSRGRAPG